METKTITTADILEIQGALNEAIEYIAQITDERYENPIALKLIESYDLLKYISLWKCTS